MALDRNSMRVAIFSTEFPPGPGGIGTHAFELARNLGQRGWRTSVVACQDYSSEEDIASFNRRQTFHIERLRPIAGAPLEAIYRLWKGIRHLRSARPSLLVASGERAAQIVWALSLIHRVPWVAVGHGGEFGTPSAFTGALVRWTYGRASAVICVSDFTRKFMEARGIRPQRVFVIPNGADERLFRVLARAESEAIVRRLPLPAASRFILTVGNVCDRKGQEIVIRAMPEILKHVPDACYVMAGLPTIADRLRDLARDLGVIDRVRFLGRLDGETVVGLMNAAAVFAMTSQRSSDGDFEGFGIAVVEAALCGTPSVVTADSGLSEAIESGETGIGVAEGDVGGVASAVVRLLTDDDLRRRMGGAARSRALRDQTWGHRMVQYDRLLRMLISRGPMASPIPAGEGTEH